MMTGVKLLELYVTTTAQRINMCAASWKPAASVDQAVYPKGIGSHDMRDGSLRLVRF